MYRILLPILSVVFFVEFASAQSSQQLSSPDGKLNFTFDLSHDGTPSYKVFYTQTPVILSSALGLNGWEKEFVLSDVTRSEKDTSWKPLYGERSLVKDHYKEMI